MRICYAAELLRKDSDLSVTEVCYSSGYADLANFIRAFRLYIGCSPRQYRRCHLTSMFCPKRQEAKLALMKPLFLRYDAIRFELPYDLRTICELKQEIVAHKKAISAKNF